MGTLFLKQLIFNIHSFFSSMNVTQSELITGDEKALVLTAKSSDEILAMGGLLLKNPEKFDVYTLTNSFKDIETEQNDYEEKVEFKKKEFYSIMEEINVNASYFFDDIDQNRLIMRYDKFKTIGLADYKYIFIPNILEQNRDCKAIPVLLSELLKKRPYRNDVKIVMYEVNSALALPNFFADITDTFDKKLNFIEKYNIKEKANKKELIKNLNSYRGTMYNKAYAESYCVLTVDEFKKLSKMYSI